MTTDREKKGTRKTRERTRFVVTREFSGGQTMQEAFEQLIEEKTGAQFAQRKTRKAE